MTAVFKHILPLALLLGFFSCKNEPKKTESQVSAQPEMETIKVNPVPTEGAATFRVSEGTVEWSGTKTVKKTGHQGTISVEGGELLVNQGQLLSGRVTLDMNSISVTDIKDPGERRDLESHLKDTDFFEADKFPKAEFVFDEVLPGNTPDFNFVLVGKLTMKGQTNAVNIPVTLQIAENELRAETPTFQINRTQWGVNFRSGVLSTVKDKMIDDTVPLRLSLVAKKQE